MADVSWRRVWPCAAFAARNPPAHGCANWSHGCTPPHLSIASDFPAQVKKRDGSIEILPGPVSTFIDPINDEAITLRAATKIDASEALVIAKQKGDGAGAASGGSRAAGELADSTVEHRIVRGPAKFIPAPDEWVQQKLREHIADENSYMEM